MELKNAKQAAPDIYWVGVLDKDLRVFDIIMRTEYGTTYNAYLVRGSEKTALFETCKAPFFEEHLAKIREICDPSEIDYIVVNHTEPDHSGSIERLLDYAPHAQVVGTNAAIGFCKEIVNRPFSSIVVKDGDTLSLGDKTLRFLAVPFLHWPDTMYTYLPECQALFTCDSFGCHYADDRVFSDLIDGDFLDAYRYYFDNILGPYKQPHMINALNKIKDLDIRLIGNGHGPVLRGADIEKYISLYRAWSEPQPKKEKSVVIAYVSAYGYTAALAREIAAGLAEEGVKDVSLFDLTETGEEPALNALKKADGMLFGSPTILGDSLPPINRLLCGLNPTIDKGKKAGAFGSYAWSGEAVPNLEARLQIMKFALPVPGCRVRLKPSAEQLAGAKEFGRQFAAAL